MVELNEERLGLILKILEKVAARPELAPTLAGFAESLTIDEAMFVAIAFKNPQESQSDLQEVWQSIQPLLKCYEALGVPMSIPICRMNSAQKQAIEDSAEDFQTLSKVAASLRKRWESAAAFKEAASQNEQV